MKHPSVKAILSSLLLLMMLYLGFSGCAMYFGRTGLILGITRHTLRQTHIIVGFVICILALIHFCLNMSLFTAEWRTLRKKDYKRVDKSV